VLTSVLSTQFRRDVKRVEKRGKDMGKLRTVLVLLLNETELPRPLRDHPLQGDWKGYRELHIEPDWLIIYRVAGYELHLARTGSHSDLFDD
jgi:mRNA interferase YafQ